MHSASGAHRLPRRILHVGLSLNPAGTESLILGAYRRLDRSQLQFDFAVPDGPRGPFTEEVIGLGARVFPYPVPSAIRPWPFDRAIQRILREHGPFHAVHAHNYYRAGTVVRLAAAEGVPLRIAHSHFTEDGVTNSVYRRLYRTYARRLIHGHATHQLGCSREACERLFGPDCWADPRTAVVHNGIDLSVFETLDPDGRALRQELGLRADAVLVGHVGRFVAQKNHAFLVEVFAELARRRNDAVLILVGAGALRPTIEQRVRELGLQERVRFVGLRADLPKVLASLDVLALPSLYEGFPLVLVEAQAAGTPAVVSSTITREVDLGTGLMRFVDLGDAPAWADHLEHAIGEKRRDRAALRALLRDAGYEIADVTSALATLYSS